jgi:hypothetical protein
MGLYLYHSLNSKLNSVSNLIFCEFTNQLYIFFCMVAVVPAGEETELLVGLQNVLVGLQNEGNL